jgi:hypothetical protein
MDCDAGVGAAILLLLEALPVDVVNDRNSVTVDEVRYAEQSEWQQGWARIFVSRCFAYEGCLTFLRSVEHESSIARAEIEVLYDLGLV